MRAPRAAAHGFSAFAAAIATLTLAATASAATLTVTSTANSGPGSLRDTISAAASGDTIVFAPSLDGQTITLTTGALTINKSLTISGPGASTLTISGGGVNQVFAVGGGASGAAYTISGLTITDGSSSFGAGAINAGLNASTGANSLTLADDVISNSHETSTSYGAGGGGIGASLATADSLTITGSTITGNTALNGAGLLEYGPGAVTITNSTISANTASIGANLGSGGGIFVQAPTTVTDSTFSDNSAATGGGAYMQVSTGTMTATINGSTFSGNQATEPGTLSPSGGGMFVQNGTVSVSNSTFTGNSAIPTGSGSGHGGAIFRCCGAPPIALSNDTVDANSATGPSSAGGDVASANGQPTVTAINTIIADGVAATAGYQNCGEYETSLGHNLSSGNCGLTQASDKTNTAPMLASLANNGGPTETMAPLAGSPAIDAGSAASSCPATDQRGDSRPDSGEPECDIGAYEHQDGTSGGGGGGGGKTPAPTCTLTKRSAVKLGKHTKNHKPKKGMLVLKVKCDEAVTVTLRWTVILHRPKGHHGAKTKRFVLRRLSQSLPANATTTLSVRLAKAALVALLAGERESATLSFTATAASGSYTTTEKIKRLRR